VSTAFKLVHSIPFIFSNVKPNDTDRTIELLVVSTRARDIFFRYLSSVDGQPERHREVY